MKNIYERIYLTENDEDIWKRYYFNNIWTPYLISNSGKVYSQISNIVMKQYIVPHTGYHRIELRIQGKPIRKYVHVMVMETFCPVRFTWQIEVNHKDGNKSNNCLYNLEWCTRSENEIHAYKNGLKVSKYGEYGTNSKYSDFEIHQVCALLESGKSVKYVSKLTGVSEGYIRDIRIGKYRYDISSVYDLSRIEKRYIEPESKTLMNNVFKLLRDNENIKPKEVCEKLNIEYNNKTRCKIKTYRKMFFDNNKGSTTRES